MDNEDLKEGDLVEHLASGERGLITDVETRCAPPLAGFTCKGVSDESHDHPPTGDFSLSLGFEKELHGVAGDLLRKIEPSASTTWDTGKSDILGDIAKGCELIRDVGGLRGKPTTECVACGRTIVEGLRQIEYLTGLCLNCAHAALKRVVIKTICMECETVITDGPDGPLSHGICVECIPDFLKRGGVSDEKIKKHMEKIANEN